MKNKITAKLVEIGQGLLFFGGICLCACEPVEAAPVAAGIYPEAFMVVEVKEINLETDLVTVVNQSGSEFALFMDAGEQPGNLISAILDDAGTPAYIDDDFIIAAEWSGIVDDPETWVKF